jgi:hypothetical protein
MEMELAMGLRNMLLCGAIVTSVSIVREVPEAVARPFRKFLSFIRNCSLAIRDFVRKKSSSDFWEIDMTKFEP